VKIDDNPAPMRATRANFQPYRSEKGSKKRKKVQWKVSHMRVPHPQRGKVAAL
jgi:hypothetical protein